VSDRRLLRAILATLGVGDDRSGAVFAVVDKLARQPRDVSRGKLREAGLRDDAIDTLLEALGSTTLDDIERRFSNSVEVQSIVSQMRRYFECLEGLGVLEWVTIDLTIVRGLAYYTGIVFELFDATGELRAICGGGRYDTLLKSLGGVDLPALGFGMGDVVLGELLRDRGLLPQHAGGPQVWVAAESVDQSNDVRRAATALRRHGVSVEYALREQPLMKQVKAAKSAGAEWVLTLHAPATAPERHTWNPAPPAEWNRVIADIGL
jgi:histidyl-tRNA synthetase